MLWSGAWSLASVGITAGLRVIGVGSGSFLGSLPSVVIGGAFVGFVAGGGFSIALAAAFRHRDVGGIGYAPFVLTGAAVAGVLVPTIFYVPMILSGVAVSGIELAVNAAVASALGGSTALGMLRLARRSPTVITAADGSPSDLAALHDGAG